VQSAGQFIPTGVDVAVPLPDPVVDTVRSYKAANVATVDVAEDGIAISQVVLVPAASQTPLHPVNTTFGAGDAVKTIGVPAT